MKRNIILIVGLIILLALSLSSCQLTDILEKPLDTSTEGTGSSITTGTGGGDSLEPDPEPLVCSHQEIVVDKRVMPTCTETGLTQGSHCADCGAIIVEQRIIEKAPHSEVSGGRLEPTCKESGYIGRVYCAICKEVLVPGEEIPKLPHTEIDLVGYPSTCKESGLSDGKYCTVCKTETVKQIELVKLSHNEIITKAIEPTCQSKGYTEKRECSVCGTVTRESVEIPKGDHTVVIDRAVAPTCKTTGLSQGSHCSVCNEILVEQSVLPANQDHVYPEFATVTKAPTLSSSGSGSIACTLCGASQNITFSKLSSSKLTKDDIYSIETSIYNPAYDNRWKIVDGTTKVSSIYGTGDWFGNVGDVLTITLKQEMVLTGLKIYTAGNYTFATIRVKDTAGNTVLSKGITAHGASDGGDPQIHTLASNTQLKAYTIEIEITGLKWDDPKTLKVSELEITAAKQDTRISHTHAYRDFVENTRVASCQQTGLDLYKCFCGHEREIESKKGDHVYSTLIAVKNVTCIDDGTATYECQCGETKTIEAKATGHTYHKLVEYSVVPTLSKKGLASYKCNNCTLIEERELAPLPLEEINYLRVNQIGGGKVVLRLNMYGTTPMFEVRYSTNPIDESNFSSATLIEPSSIEGERLITITLDLNASFDNCYYVAVRPYYGINYGKVASVRAGGGAYEIPIDYEKAQVLHGEVLNSFRSLFDNDTSTTLGVVFPNSGDTAELYGSTLRPIVDLEYLHFVEKIRLYFTEAGSSITVRWSKTPVDFMASNTDWEGCSVITAESGWNNIEINQETRYIQIVFTDGEAPYEVEAYGYQCGEGDEIATERGTLPTMGEMMGMCGFVAGGNGHTPPDEVSSVNVLREYHNFGWTYFAKFYGSKASFFTGITPEGNKNWMGNFDYEYSEYKKAGLTVIPCIQLSLGNGETISYRVGEDKKPVYSDGSLIRATFWERFDPHTYFVFADSLFAFSARYGTNSSNELFEIAQNFCSDVPSVGQGTIEWIEMGNEPEGAWNGIHNYLSAYQLAAATSAAYDGHCRTMVSVGDGGYHLGGKNADPNIKLAMAGVSGISNEYIMALCYWMKANRQDGKTAFDAFNVHNYMTKVITLPDGSSCSVGISPEEANIAGTLSHLISIRDKYYPEKEVWITEFGWDTNQSYATSTSAHAYAEYTGRQVQAMWLTRTYLILSAIGIDKADMYMCHGGNDETSVGKYGTCGVIGVEYDENGNEVKVKKDSYYYLYTLKNTLGNYTFDEQIEAYDENVLIYKYKTAEGRTAYALWCKTSDGTKVDNYQLRIDGTCATIVEAVYGDCDGVKTRITSDEYSYVSVNVSENPVYVVVE
ncbi:MAG: hypothetical protein IJ004_01925 [Clostridia bacterium]|nr:hypothetical protein [Clostridia bacterium]